MIRAAVSEEALADDALRNNTPDTPNLPQVDLNTNQVRYR